MFVLFKTLCARFEDWAVERILYDFLTIDNGLFSRTKSQLNRKEINHGSGTQLQHNQLCHGQLGASQAYEELRGGRRSCPLSTVRCTLITY
jgi:hypothetical protein